MAIAEKLVQVNQVKQDIKTAIETKGIPMTNVAFTEYANKILDIKPPYLIYDENEPLNWSWAYYIYSQSDALEKLTNAWEHSFEVDISEIETTSNSTTQYGKLQYPDGETFGVIIPNGTTKIGKSGFIGWTSNNQPLVIPDSVTSIEGSAFDDWTSNNQPLVIPNSVTNIGSYAFRGWKSNNQPLVIPDSVTSIGSNAFQNWTSNNQPLVIQNSATIIGYGAFRGWTSNNQPLVIPDSVTSINNYAFQNWTSNNQPLVIPDSVTSIGSNAFQNWTLVPYVEIKSIIPPSLSSSNAFGFQGDAPIYVPDESVDDYKTTTNWVDLVERIFPISSKP